MSCWSLVSTVLRKSIRASPLVVEYHSVSTHATSGLRKNAEPSGSAVSGIQAIREAGNSSAPERSEARLLQRSKVLHNYVTCSDVLFNAYQGASP